MAETAASKSRSLGKFAGFAALLALGCQPKPDASGANTASADATSAANTPASAATDDNAVDTSAGTEGDDPPLPAPPVRGETSAPKGTPQALVAEADRELQAMKSTSYEHHTSIDEAAGRFDFDCSGFVGYALEGAAPAAWSELVAATKPRPLAKHFETFFAAIPAGGTKGHWMHVAHIADLRPGDIIAWLQPADSTSKNTGHVLVVHGAVRPEDGAPGTFYVPIVDSTALKHGAKDSRAEANATSATNATGLGSGTILLVGDASGAPSAFRWSSGRKSRERATPIALGRLVP